LPEHLRFFDAMRLWSRAFPPPAAERDHLERFEPLGLLADDGVYSQVDASRFAGLGEGRAAGKAEIDELAQASPDGGGWTTTLHTTTSTTSGRGRSTPRNGRSAAARRRSSRARSPPGPGCGAITPTRRSTPSSTDENGDQLDGARRYEMHLSEPLPVDSFWSLTMYDVPDYFLVANPIDRYSIGDRTRGLVAEPDASLTIYIQHDEPDDESQRANWLPAPTGQFRPALRMYTPRQPLLDGSYTLPRIRRVG
jgi:hypothetical protein